MTGVQTCALPISCVLDRSAGLRGVAGDLRGFAGAHAALGDADGLDGGVGRDLVHDLRHDLLHDGPQAAGADLAFDGLFGNGLQRALFEAQLDLIVGQQLVVLLAERVFRLGQDADEIVLAQSLQRGDDRQTADQLGDDAEFQKIVRLDQLEELADVEIGRASCRERV